MATVKYHMAFLYTDYITKKKKKKRGAIQLILDHGGRILTDILFFFLKEELARPGFLAKKCVFLRL